MLDKFKKELASLQVKTDKTEAEVSREQELKSIILALEDKSSDDNVDYGTDKKFSADYVKELRDEAKSNRIKARDVESELAITKAKLDNIDHEDYAQLKSEREKVLKEREEAAMELKKKEGDFDALIADNEKKFGEQIGDLMNKHSAEVFEYKSTIKSLKSQNESLFFADAYNSAVAASELEIRDPEGVRLRIEREQIVEVDEETGKLSVVLKGADGEVRLDDSGVPMTVKDRLLELKAGEVTSYMFASIKEGAGSSSDTQGDKKSTEPNPFNPATVNFSRQGILLKTNPEEYRRLEQEYKNSIK